MCNNKLYVDEILSTMSKIIEINQRTNREWSIYLATGIAEGFENTITDTPLYENIEAWAILIKSKNEDKRELSILNDDLNNENFVDILTDDDVFTVNIIELYEAVKVFYNIRKDISEINKS